MSDASHELRTPLAILKTELELALRTGRTPAELRAALASAEEETDRVAQLAEDLLVIARSEGGRLPVRLAPVDAAELLGGVRARYERRANEEGRELNVTATEGLALTVDPLRHGEGTVHIAAREHDGTVDLRVSDEGAGFPEDFLGHVFERFTRADTARGRGGSGLGLAIVQAIARAHGGRAGATNGTKGAEVWMEIPARGQQDRPPGRRATPH